MIELAGSERLSTIRLAVVTQYRSVTDRQTHGIAITVSRSV